MVFAPVFPMQKYEVEPFISLTNLLEQSIGCKVLDISLGDDLDLTPKSKATKAKMTTTNN